MRSAWAARATAFLFAFVVLAGSGVTRAQADPANAENPDSAVPPSSEALPSLDPQEPGEAQGEALPPADRDPAAAPAAAPATPQAVSEPAIPPFKPREDAGARTPFPPQAMVDPETPLVTADPFPLPPGYVGHVEFWKNVFGVWTRSQVALHDLAYPGLVYDVLDLGGDAGSAAAQAVVRDRKAELEARLKRLEVMVATGVALNDDEKALAILITTRAGTQAIVGASDRVRTQRGIRERFRQGLEISARYDAAFRKVFRDAGLPEDLANLPHVESSFENIARSSAGAIGMWQFTRPAGKRFMTITSSIDERYDPLAAARGAARYLKVAHELLDSWPMAITSYNHGMEGMARARGRFGTDFEEIVRSYDGRAFGFASKNFYAEFLAAREIARDPARFFPEGLSFDPPLFLDEVVLASAATPKQIAKRYSIPVRDLAALNPGWSHKAVSHDRAIPAGVSVWLAGGTLERLAEAAAARAAAASAAKKASSAKAPVAQVARAAQPPAVSATGGSSMGSGLAQAVTHVVRSGETLFKIATLYGVTLESLLSSNRLTERSVIHPGQQLKVPQLR